MKVQQALVPLLHCCSLDIGLGFPAMAADIAEMMIQSTPFSFGVVGNPDARRS